MPIPVHCPTCEAKLNAPDAAAGKKVKCPKCGAMLVIPRPGPDADFEVIEEAQTKLLPPIKRAPQVPPAAGAKPKPVELEADDEDERPTPRKRPLKKPVVALDDEDEEFEPRPKKTPARKVKKTGGMNLPLVLGGATLAVAVVCGLVWYFVIREPEYTFVTPPLAPQDSGEKGGKGPAPLGPGDGGGGGKQVKTPPTGWTELKADDFTTWVNASGRISKSNLVAPAGGPTGGTHATFTKTPNGFQGVSSYSLHPAARAAVERDLNKYLEDNFINRVEGADLKKTFLSRTDSLLGGKPARDAVIKSPERITFCRGAVVGDRLYVLSAYADNVTEAKDDYVRLFFDNFKFTGK